MPSLDEILQGGSDSFRRLNRDIAGKVPADPDEKPVEHIPVAPAVPHTQSQPDLSPALDSLPPAEERGPCPTPQRPRVEIFLHRVKLLDTDNKWGSVKPILDALREAGLIPDDKESDIELVVTQSRVKSYDKEGTGLRITYQ